MDETLVLMKFVQTKKGWTDLVQPQPVVVTDIHMEQRCKIRQWRKNLFRRFLCSVTV